MTEFYSITFYKYFENKNPEDKRDFYKNLMLEHNIKGKIILAEEGINGAIAGKIKDCEEFLAKLTQIDELSDMTWRTTTATTNSCFKRTLVKIRPEIVPLGIPDITSLTAGGGKFIKPEELLEWYKNNEEFILLDTRNTYELEEGKFVNSINPQIDRFRDFSKFVETIGHLKNKKIVTCCTGGVRCEKASAYMKSQGFKNVLKLEGGIIEFLKIAGNSEFYEGRCFVFDNRISVGEKDCSLLKRD